MEATTENPASEALASSKRRIPTVALVLLAVIVQRSVTALVMLWRIGPDAYVTSLMAYDAGWYKQVAEFGYRLAGEDGNTLSNLAFFPLFPATAKLVAVLPGVTLSGALLALAFVGSVLAALPIFAIGKHLYSARVGALLALMWGASPQSFVLVMGYAEGWFTTASGWSLLFMLRQRPLAAAGAAVVAGLIRPAAVPLVLVVMAWCLVQWCKDSQRSGRWVAGAVIAPLGLGSFVLYVAWRTGELFGYFSIQKEWNLQTGPPWAFWEQIVQRVRTTDAFAISMDIHIAVVLGYVALLVILVGRIRWVGHGWLVLYTLLGAAMVVTRVTYFWSEPRQFMPLFPLLLPLATIQSSRWAWSLMLLGGTMATAWLGAEFLLARQYSP